jgi:subtilisin family serine protease
MFIVETSLGKTLGKFQGNFEICQRPIIVTKANLLKAHLIKRVPEKTVRLCALIDSKVFSESDLRQFGWNVIYRIGNIVTLQGDAESALYLEAVDGLHFAERPWGIPIKCMTMDSVKKLTRANYVNGTISSSLKQAYTGKNVLVGIIDTEFDIHHPDFLNAQGKTRFIALWDQVDSLATRRTGSSYGKIKLGQQLDSDSSFGLNGEFHGTLMASYAAGSDRTTPYFGMAPEAMIVGVKYDNNYVSADVINGLTWIFHLADSLKVPCVVSLSIGVADGPHDGTSATDQAIDAVSTVSSGHTAHIVVGAIGNDGANHEHIGFALASGQKKSTWIQAVVDSLKNPARAQAISGGDFWGDSNKSFSATLYILNSKSMKYKLSNSISTQNKGPFIPDTIMGSSTDSILNQGDTLIFYTFIESKSSLNQKPHMEIELISNNPDLVMGISFSYLNSTSGTINGWSIVKRDFLGDSIIGFFDGDNVSSLNEVGGTAKKIITAGGYISKSQIIRWDSTFFDKGLQNNLGQLSLFSGKGPTIDGRIKPDITAPAEFVVGAMSRLAADFGRTVIWPDTYSTNGRYCTGTGTSVSSPIVAGAIALMLQADSTLTLDQAKQILQTTAITDQNTNAFKIPGNDWGWGKLDAYGAVAKILGDIPTKNVLSRTNSSIGIVVLSTGQRRLISIHYHFAKPANFRLDLFSLDGHRILSENVPAFGVDLPLSLAKGVYIARVFGDEKPLANQKIGLW